MNNKLILISLLIALVALSVFGAVKIPLKYPSTKEILNNPSSHEGKIVEVRGTVKKIKQNDEVILERFGREFIVKNTSLSTENIREGDLLDVQGTSYLEDGYIEAMDTLHREAEVHSSLVLRSLIGGFLFLGILVYFSRDLLEVLWFG